MSNESSKFQVTGEWSAWVLNCDVLDRPSGCDRSVACRRIIRGWDFGLEFKPLTGSIVELFTVCRSFHPETILTDFRRVWPMWVGNAHKYTSIHLHTRAENFFDMKLRIGKFRQSGGSPRSVDLRGLGRLSVRAGDRR
jgi:hypothetical protein